MVEYFSVINDRRVLESNRGTIDQLKHSGSLRYFKNKQFTGELIRYYNVLDIVDHWIQYLFDYESSTLGPFSREHFDSRYNDIVFRTQQKLKPFRNIRENEQIILYNISTTFGKLNKILSVYILTDALEKAGKLIRLIKQEYQLK